MNSFGDKSMLRKSTMDGDAEPKTAEPQGALHAGVSTEWGTGTAMSKKYRIIIAEDYRILREGLRALIAADPALEVVAEIENGRDTLRAVATLKPDLVLTDLSMPVMDGLSAIREIKRRYPEVRTLALTVHRTEEYIRQTLEAGASGYMLKDTSRQELIQAIHTVLRGNTYISPAVSERIIGSYLDGNRVVARGSANGLTERERQVLKLVAEGYRNKDVAQTLCISVKTVEKHRASLMQKLNVRTAPALAAYAIENGLVDR
jgi:DNA-binding NarL/FixJ family response regulator